MTSLEVRMECGWAGLGSFWRRQGSTRFLCSLWLLFLSPHLLLWFWLSRPLFPLLGSLWLLGSTQITQVISHLKTLNLITFERSLLPCKVTYSQISGIGIWTSLERKTLFILLGLVPPSSANFNFSASPKVEKHGAIFSNYCFPAVDLDPYIDKCYYILSLKNSRWYYIGYLFLLASVLITQPEMRLINQQAALCSLVSEWVSWAQASCKLA